ncbi:MAG: hypothetical protein EXS14_09995 [Planctomycetes bacterium]|nr:hypothetical protein [Planctomycetota bacterium]
MRTLYLTAIICFASSLAPAQLSQTLPAGFDAVDGPSSTPYLINNTPDQKWQWVYDSAQFSATYQILISEIYVRAASSANAVNAFSFANLTATLASSNNNYTVGSHNTNYAANMGIDASMVRTGPWTSPAVPANVGFPTATWIPLGLTTPFTFDPTLGKDLIVQLTKCGTPTVIWGPQMDGTSGAAGTVGGNRYGTLNNCTSATWSFSNNEFAPIIRIDYLPANSTPMYQVNVPGCIMDINGGVGASYQPASVSRCIGSISSATFAVTPGNPFEIGVQFGPLVAANAGGMTLPNGSVFNLVFGSPTLFFINGGAFPVFYPSPGTFVVPFATPPGTVAAQTVALDPTAPGGLALSQGCQLTGTVGAASVAGPTGDDTSTTHLLGAAPLCGPTGVPFYGAMQTLLHVISNGRAMFGTTPNVSFTATTLAATSANPFFGAWCDLNYAAGSTVTLSAPNPNTVRVDYTNMIYWGTTVTNTFALIIDSSGTVQFDGLTGLAVGPLPGPVGTSSNQFLGISTGGAGTLAPGSGAATDLGATIFAVGGPNVGPTGLGMTYAFGAWGSLHTGINNITFMPNGAGNYDWAAF